MDHEKMTVLVIEPEKKPYVKDISSGLASLQKEVGGYIQAVYPFEDPVAIICDEEAKLTGKELNRALRDEDGQIYDIVAGSFLVAGLGEEDFCSLTPEQIKKFSDMYKTPEMFLRLNGKLMVLPMEEKRELVKKPSVLQKLNDLKDKDIPITRERKSGPLLRCCPKKNCGKSMLKSWLNTSLIFIFPQKWPCPLFVLIATIGSSPFAMQNTGICIPMRTANLRSIIRK